PPDRRVARRLRRRRDGLRAREGARAGEPRPRPARPTVRRRRVLHDRRGRGRPPRDAVADTGHQDRRRGRPARLRAPGRVRRGHRGDGREGRRLARGKEASRMSAILTYVLHYEGAFNTTSLGAVSEAAKRAKDVGLEAHAVVVGEDVSDDLAKTLGNYGATKV